MFELFNNEFFLVADLGDVRVYSLVIGLAVFAGGVLMLMNHKRHIDELLASQESDRVKAFETRKYRRRASVSTMIACLGCMLGALYWVTDQKVFAVFILMILGLLLGIFGLALIDLFSVSLHHIATPDQHAQKKMIEEYLREREKLVGKVAAIEEERSKEDG